jgi:hypothetical protein
MLSSQQPYQQREGNTKTRQQQQSGSNDGNKAMVMRQQWGKML